MRWRRTVVALLGAAIAAVPFPAAAEPPYAKEMERLAEILGSLHYLTGLCGGTSSFRDEMQALLDTDAPDNAFRAELVDRFNLGFSSFAAVYRRCTPAASEAIARYRADGAALAETIATEFGAPKPDLRPQPAG